MNNGQNAGLAVLAIVVGGFLSVVAYGLSERKREENRCHAIPAPTTGCESVFGHPNFKPNRS